MNSLSLCRRSKKTSSSITSLHVCVYSATDPAAQATSSALLPSSLSLFNFCVYFCRSCRNLALVLPAQVSASSPTSHLQPCTKDYPTIYIFSHIIGEDEAYWMSCSCRCPENKQKSILKCHIFSSRDGPCEHTRVLQGAKTRQVKQKVKCKQQKQPFLKHTHLYFRQKNT